MCVRISELVQQVERLFRSLPSFSRQKSESIVAHSRSMAVHVAFPNCFNYWRAEKNGGYLWKFSFLKSYRTLTSDEYHASNYFNFWGYDLQDTRSSLKNLRRVASPKSDITVKMVDDLVSKLDRVQKESAARWQSG
eukprot:TRINITY_DN6676_c0_g1_i7.p1 TRINITY_DN6676_c0_g1~~TRINITY_DN6676_c0_g1_i7.p1  ORF type:complete len:136 (+),score=14.86 TRINITY_DN6676_c0_g1_i7:228-635(+)